MKKRVFACLMVACLILGMLPMTALAADEENAVATKITSMDQFVSGYYVLISDTGVAMGDFEDDWITAKKPIFDGDKIVGWDDEGIIRDVTGLTWTLKIEETGVSMRTPNSKAIAPKGGRVNGIKNAAYEWTVSFEDGKFIFTGTGADEVYLASNTNMGNMFRAYKGTTFQGENGKGFVRTFDLYRVSGDVSTETTEPTEPVATDPNAPSEPEPTVPVEKPVDPAQKAAELMNWITVLAVVLIAVSGVAVVTFLVYRKKKSESNQ